MAPSTGAPRTGTPHRALVLAVVAVGGAVGSLGRYALGRLLTDAMVATLVGNVLGCLALGLVLGWFPRLPQRPVLLHAFCCVGVLGGFTTFSTFAVLTIQTASAGHLVLAALEVIGSVLVGLLAVLLGHGLARRLSPPRASTPEPGQP